MKKNGKKRGRISRWFSDHPVGYDRKTFRNNGGFREMSAETAGPYRYQDAEIKSRYGLVLFFAVAAGLLTGFLVWFFFLCLQTGKDLLWPQDAHYLIDRRLYTAAVLFSGAVLTGMIQKTWPGYPKGLHNLVSSIREKGSVEFDNVIGILLCTLVPLIFGSAVGPEASLMSFVLVVILYLCRKFKASPLQTQIAQYIGVSAGLGACFLAPLFGFMEVIEQPMSLETEDEIIFPRTKRLIVYFTAILSAIIITTLLDHWIPAVAGVPRFSPTSRIGRSEYLLFLPVSLIAGFTGTLFRFFSYAEGKVLKPVEDRPVFKAVLAAAVMYVAFEYFPLVQFTGESQIETLIVNYHAYTPAYLFATTLLKLFMTSLCVMCGWRGGNLYPTIFSGVCMGYGFALLFPYADSVFLVAVSAGALCGGVLRKPMAIITLLLLCFPVNLIVWVFAAAFIGSLIPASMERNFSFF